MLDEAHRNDIAARDDDKDGARPLVVDLDGTLVRTDLLYESFWSTAINSPSHYVKIVKTVLAGKACVKQYLANEAKIEYGALPYVPTVIDAIEAARAQGRKVYLATASDAVHAQAIVEHLGVFDGTFSSDGTTNLDGERKARRLVEAFGEKGFDYIANGKVDLAVWKHAARAIAVNAPQDVLARLRRDQGGYDHLECERVGGIRQWIRGLRVHQYAKNALLFVPLLTAHLFTVSAIRDIVLAFVAFSLCASSVYLLNDLVDLNSDRLHPTKKTRPLAAGTISIRSAMIAQPILLVISLLLALTVSPGFLAVLLGYLVLTTAYSFYLKRKMMIDVVALAGLYSIRVLAGAVAIGVAVSEWLLAFSLFFFTSLALIKRYSELTSRLDRQLPDPSNRNYRVGDLDIVVALAAAAGMNAVTVFTLYVSSPSVKLLYARPELLYLAVPLLLYWLMRAIMMAHRRLMDDDPVVFALTDRNSRIAGVLMVMIVLLAAWRQ